MVLEFIDFWLFRGNIRIENVGLDLGILKLFIRGSLRIVDN